jgi:hypothetical protein
LEFQAFPERTVVKLKVNGVDIPMADKIEIEVETDSAGERLVPVSITNVGGVLSVYKSDVTVSGSISIHIFSDGALPA